MRILRLIVTIVGAAVATAALGGAWWVHSLGPAPRGEALEYSTLVVDREGWSVLDFEAADRSGNVARLRQRVFVETL